MADVTGSFNAVLEVTAPSASAQRLVGKDGSDKNVYRGTVQVTLDGSGVSAVVNYIDGTATIPYLPGGIIVSRTAPSTGGTAIAPSTAYSQGDMGLDTNSAVVVCVQAGTTSATVSSGISWTTTVGNTTTYGTAIFKLLQKADTAAKTIYAQSAEVIDAKTFRIYFSGAGSASQLATFAFLALKGF